MEKCKKLVLKEVRCVWPKLFTPDEFKGKSKYSIGLLIPKDSDNWSKIQDAIKETISAQFGPAEAPKKLKSFKTAGVTKMPIKPYDDEETTFLITPKLDASKGKPRVFNRNKTDLNPESGLPYAGCWVNVSIDVFCHNKEGGGIAFYLNGVQFVREDARLEGGASHVASSKDDFDDLGDDGSASANGTEEDVW